MNIESQCTSLELSKKLKELGVKQESLFYWTLGGIVYHSELPFFLDTNNSAFSASELLEMLPINFRFEKRKSGNQIYWYVETPFDEDIAINMDFLSAETKLSDSIAQMIIYLIEQGLYKP